MKIDLRCEYLVQIPELQMTADIQLSPVFWRNASTLRKKIREEHQDFIGDLDTSNIRAWEANLEEL